MSSTQIYGFCTDGEAYLNAEIHNSWRGGMAIWGILEQRYLPPHRPSYVPAHIHDEQVEAFCHYKPTRISDMMNPNAMKEIWNLFDSANISETDKIVLGTTFDWVVVRKEGIPKVIQAFNSFEGETSLKEQAEILQAMYEDERCIAVAWNQTSVNGDIWTDYEYDEESDESRPYNLNRHDKHWFLLDNPGLLPAGQSVADPASQPLLLPGT